jgi:hypothetical protein
MPRSQPLLLRLTPLLPQRPAPLHEPGDTLVIQSLLLVQPVRECRPILANIVTRKGSPRYVQVNH